MGGGGRYGDGQRSEFRFDSPGDRERFTHAWATHYNDTYMSKDKKMVPERSMSPMKPRCPTSLPIAGVSTSPHKSSFDIAGRIPPMTTTRQEYFSTTLRMEHRSLPDKRIDHVNHTLRSSASVIGQHFVNSCQETPSRANTPYAQAKKPLMVQFAGIEVDRLYPSTQTVRKNDRVAWNRNASNVGQVVFNEGGSSKLPKNGRHKLYNSRKSRSHFETVKGVDDKRIMTSAAKSNHYMSDGVVNHLGYNVRHKKVDDTTVSGDAPPWMHLPGVNVNSLNSVQLASLLSWDAPVPAAHIDPKLLNVFQGDESNRPEVHPELKHLPKHMQTKFVDNSKAIKLRKAYGEAANRALNSDESNADRARSSSAPPKRANAGQDVSKSHDTWSARGTRPMPRYRQTGGTQTVVASMTYSPMKAALSPSDPKRKGWC